MLFFAKLDARVALLVMLGLLLVSNLWAGARGFALADALTFNVLSLAYIAAGLVFSASLDSVIYIAGWTIGFHPFLDSFKAGYTRLFARVGFPAILAGGLLAGLGEETFFRGVLQREWGILPVAILFALAHVGRGLTLFSVWALLEGLVFGALYQLTGNLLVPMVVHGLHDSAGMFFGRYIYGRYFPPAPTLADWLRDLNTPAGRKGVTVWEPVEIPAGDEDAAPAAPRAEPPAHVHSAAQTGDELTPPVAVPSAHDAPSSPEASASPPRIPAQPASPGDEEAAVGEDPSST